MKSIEKHEHFLRLISNIVKFFGLLVLSAPIVIFILLFLFDLSDGKQTNWFTHNLKILKIIPYALLLLGLDQFIKFIVKNDSKPNWFIRYVDIFIYIYVIYLIINFCYVFIHRLNSPDFQGIPLDFFHQLIVYSLSAISTFVRVLFWTALGLVLRKIVPIVEEVKSLV